MSEKFLPEFEPYLAQVKSDKIRESILAIWKDLFEQSDWKDIYDCPSELDVTAISLVQHTANVTSYVIELGTIYGEAYADHDMVFNMDNLIAGAMLHDVSKLMEYTPTPHGAVRSEVGRLYVEKFFALNQIIAKGLPFEVLHMVVSDSPETKAVPATREALVVYFADRIDMDIRNMQAGRPLRAKNADYKVLYRNR